MASEDDAIQTVSLSSFRTYHATLKAMNYASPVTPWVGIGCVVLLMAMVTAMAFYVKQWLPLLGIFLGFLSLEVILYGVFYILYPIAGLKASKSQETHYVLTVHDDYLSLDVQPMTSRDLSTAVAMTDITGFEEDRQAYYVIYRDEKKHKACLAIMKDPKILPETIQAIRNKIVKKRK